MPIILSTNERELYLNDPLFHYLAKKLVALAVEHPEYALEDGRRLNEVVNVARSILEDSRQLLAMRLREHAHPDTESNRNGSIVIDSA